jgi:hypothetical protein
MSITGNNTTVSQHGENTVVTLHATDVVTFDSESVLLRTGAFGTAGYYTATTKRRMNEASAHFGLGYRVIQQNHEWRVVFDDGREDQPFGSLSNSVYFRR